MDMKMIGGLFTLFSGETDVCGYLPLLNLAAAEVRRALREGADETDVRLCYLAAAVANLRYRQIWGTRAGVTAVYAGTVPAAPDCVKDDMAYRLVAAYKAVCRDMLRDETFFFIGIGGCDAGAD
ncbi:MAG: hypothetical protein IKN55_11035 [Oscillospiraceae bacterium]|nr:hypothetical protein [Oscillospiraceae bacterium]